MLTRLKATKIDLAKNEQKEPWFLEINPNGRIPALTDKLADGSSVGLFESGSIMQYLVDRYDPDHKVSYPHGSREYYEVNSWLFWQMGGLGPMQGQANHFFRELRLVLSGLCMSGLTLETRLCP